MANTNSRKRSRIASKLAWGIFWILIAALILSNYLGGFIELGFWSVTVGALAVAVLVYSLVSLSLAWIPIPIAALYYIFQTPLGFPVITFWPLLLVTLLVTIGLHVLLPKRFAVGKNFIFTWDSDKKGKRGDDTDALIEEGADENNPTINMQFGHVTRYLHSDCLETAEMRCAFGQMEVYFDHVQLSENGAEVIAQCKIGSIEMYVPRHWRVISHINTSLGNAEVDGQLESASEDAPTLTITGSVSMGNIEVKRLKG